MSALTLHISTTQYQAMEDDNTGVCLACHEETSGVEPDAEDYECENCGEHRVTGMMNLLLNGNIVLVSDDRRS
jgi:hypothetical protein